MGTTDCPAAQPQESDPNGLASHPDAAPATTVDGPALRDLLGAGQAWLDRHHEIVNALNVFPVPDGDTGTNMLLTVKSACQEINADDLGSVSDVAKAAAQGALMGARGNSGVILSQILRGMARSLDGQTVLTGPRLAAALSEGTRVAYKGVNRPVEGTILTVVREAAGAAEAAATTNPDLRYVMSQALQAADEAVANTPNLLPVLAQAGKVDSGGKGLFYILEGMYRALIGEVSFGELEALTQALPVSARAERGRREIPRVVYGFDVQFLVEGKNLNVEAIRAHVEGLGECALVEGDPSLVRVHVHVANPGVPLGHAVSLGFVTDIVVENMDDMALPEMPEGFDPIPPRRQTTGTTDRALPVALELEPQEVIGPAIVAVVSGPGLADVFRSLGAHLIVSGGQTMNPATKDLLAAAQKAPGNEVIILPNNANIILAAQQAQALAGNERRVAVVPSRSIPQGISALLALNLHADLDRNLQAMTAAIENVQTGEVTTAVQDARFDGIEVRSGDVIGLLNDRLTATGPDSDHVVKTLLAQMDAAALEVITLYRGEPVTADRAEALREELAALYPDQEIEVIEGGQPFYHYIISAE